MKWSQINHPNGPFIIYGTIGYNTDNSWGKYKLIILYTPNYALKLTINHV